MTLPLEHYTVRCDQCGHIGIDKDADCEHEAQWYVAARGFGSWIPYADVRPGEAMADAS